MADCSLKYTMPSEIVASPEGAAILTHMDVRSPSAGEKFVQAAVLWPSASLVSIPLWDLADLLLHAWRDGSVLGILADFFFSPMGPLWGLAIMFVMVAEQGNAAIAARYWPAILVASLVTTWVLRRWWRRG